MTYKSYEEKIKRIASVTKGIRRCAKLIVAVLIVAALATVGYLFAKGMMIGGVTCAPVVSYGDEMAPSSIVVMGNASYEYAAEGSEDWSTNPPSLPGRYRVRAVTQRSFGLVSYSKPTAFTVERRRVTVTVKEDSIPYGDMPTAVADLGEGDRFDYVELIFENDGKVFLNPTMVKVAKDTIRIVNQNGEDVTSAYEIATQDKLVDVVKRPITLETKGATKVYDGTPLSSGEYSVTAGSLMAGDVWGHLLLETKVTYVTEGVVENRPTGEIKVYNTEGMDVTDYYDITLNCGTLEILPFDIVIKTNSAEWMYGPKILAELELTEDPILPAGHTLGNIVYLLKEMEKVSPVSAGVHKNECTITLLNSTGEEVPSDNYRINGTDSDHCWGTVTVSPRPIILVTESATKEYDALPLKKAAAVLKDDQDYWILETHTIRAIEETFFTLTDVIHGEENHVENKGEAQILDADGNDVTANYALTYEYGMLTVLPRSLLIRTEGATKSYDGLPLQNAKFEATGLIEGHVFEVLASTVTGPLVNAEAILNEFTDYTVKDASGNDVQGNYEIIFNTNNPGMLQITPCPLTVTTPSNEIPFIYDAQPHELTDIELTWPDGETIPEGHTWGIAENATIVNAGTRDNTVAISIFNVQGEDVTDQFDVTYVYGTLTVDPRPIVITPLGTTKVYDGIALECKEFLVDDLASENHAVVLPSEGFLSILNVAESGVKNVFPETGYTILDGESDVTANYAITVDNSDENCGVLEITKRPITIRPQDEERVYNGMALTGSVPVDVLEALVEGHTITMQTNGAVTDAKTVNNEIIADSVMIQSTSGSDETANYEITLEKGTLTVTPRPITVTTPHDSWEYSDEAHSNSGISVTSGELVSGHEFKNVVSTGITDVGTVDNELVSYAIMYGEDDVTTNYTVIVDKGTLTVTPKALTIKTGTANQVYNGESLTSTEFTQTGLLNGHSIVDIVSSAPVLVGNYDNEFTSIRIVREDGSEVPLDNYDITDEKGELTITPLPLTYTTRSNTFEYNGSPRSCMEIDIATLPEGHTWAVANGQTVSRTDVGEIENKFDIVILNADGDDVTKCFSITADEYGRLIVKPRSITITPLGTSKVYDGTALEYREFKVDNLVNGHKVVLLAGEFVSITNVGMQKNAFPTDTTLYAIKDGDTDVTANYIITIDNSDETCGVLEVTKRPITITPLGTSKVYDGIALEHREFKVDNLAIEQHKVELLSETFATITNVGTQKNEFPTDISLYTIKNGDQDVTENYAVTVDNGENCGVLEITPRPIRVTTKGGKKTYDSTPLRNEEFAVSGVEGNEESGLLEGHEFQVKQFATQTNVGELENDLRHGYTILAQGAEVQNNYVVEETDFGILEVVPCGIHVYMQSVTRPYNGRPLVAECEKVEGLLGDHTFELTVPESIINVGTKSTLPSNWKVVASNGDVMTSNYKIVSFTEGKLEITPVEITVQMSIQSKPYDGTPLYGYAEAVTGLLEGHQLSVIDPVSITTVGVVDDVLGNWIVWAGNEDVSGNYKLVSSTSGTLTVTICELEVYTMSDFKVHDGSPLKNTTVDVRNLNNSVFQFRILNPAEITEVGETDNTFDPESGWQITTIEGEDVSEYFKVVNIIPGKLKVRSEEIPVVELTPYEIHVEYDGKPHGPREGEYWISNGISLPAGYSIADVVFTQAYTDAGTYESQVISARILNDMGEDVTGIEYDLKYVTAVVQIDPIEIIIETGSKTVSIAVGECSNSSYKIVRGQLPEDYDLDIKITGVLSTRGTVYNVIEQILITDESGNVVFTGESGSEESFVTETVGGKTYACEKIAFGTNLVIHVRYGTLTVTWR